MGTPDFAVPSLDILVENSYDVVAVVTAPDRPAGRGQKLRPSPVKEAAIRLDIPVLQPEKLKNPEFIQQLEALKPDLMVVVAFRMLPEVVWSLPGRGTFNLHASLLPDYRGAAPINWAVINGETRSGVTTFLIDHKIDTGNILLSQSVEILPDWNAGSLHDALMETGSGLVLQTVKGLENGSITPKPQDHNAAIHKAPKIFKDDCRIEWNRPASELHNFVRGLAPYPTAWTTVKGQRLKVFATQIGDLHDEKIPGTIRYDADLQTLQVSALDKWLLLEEVQAAGKKKMKIADYLRGQQIDWEEVTLGE